MSMDVIRVNNLNKTYPVGNGYFQALKDVSLRIEEGDFVAIMGRSGAGKSTLLHILGLLDNYDSGEYYLLGKEMLGLSDAKTAKLRNENIGFVLQDFSLINYRSVLFNVMLPLYFGKVPYRKMKDRAMEALKAVGIEDQAKKSANQLSGGQRQRVAIARAMVTKPSVILADEPTGALDSETSAQIMQLLKKLNEQGVTIVVVTHDELVAGACSRLLTITDGRLEEAAALCRKK